MPQDVNPIQNPGVILHNDIERISIIPQTNDSEPLEFESAGYKLGENMFQSFLLAGERHLNSGFARVGTDEERFKKLVEEVRPETQELMRGYFKRQATLDLSQRARLLGDMVDLQINDPLTVKVTAAKVFQSPLTRSNLAPIASFRPILTANPVSVTKLSTAGNRLNLYLERLKVEESQDDYWLWFPFVGKKVYNTTDEVALGIISVDENGDVKHSSHNLGSIGEGKQKTFSNKIVQSFNVDEGKGFPKIYTVNVYAIERDNGGYNEFLQKASAYLKDKITKEMIAQGITAVGGYFGINIPPEVANTIGSIVKGFFDKLVDWITKLFTNNDDVLGHAVRKATLNSANSNWTSSGTKQSKSWDWVFAGQGGRWRTTMHWKLETSSASET